MIEGITTRRILYLLAAIAVAAASVVRVARLLILFIVAAWFLIQVGRKPHVRQRLVAYWWVWLLLVPQVRSFDEIEAWARLSDGRAAVKPKPQTLALPGKQQARDPW